VIFFMASMRMLLATLAFFRLPYMHSDRLRGGI
jgi:hypothetical protein